MSTESSKGIASSEPVTASVAARALGVSVWTVYRLLRSGELAGERVGYQWRTTLHAISTYRAANSNQPVAA